VSVDDGAVTLAGTVGSSAEKREARYDAWVAGVNEVDVSGLEVGRWARDEDLRKDKYLTRSDSAVADAVEDAMLYDPRLSAFDIGVAVDDGVVTLGGQVDNVTARRVAAENARNTVGVWRVKNRIQVRTNELTDAKIKQNVLDALERDPDIRQYDIGVGVIGGEVFLSGTVDDYFDKARADDLAATAVGVSEVNNNIVVEDAGQAWTHDPYVDEYDLEGYDWQAAEEDLTTRKNDWEIYEDIRDELWWSPFVDSDEVAVSIEDGVATLTGTVDTWSEREAAQENAIEGGAIAVDNDLSVDFGPEYYQEGNQG
jgi:osmotically-inducible protein OsmY